jgi:hypothetical protein
MKTVWKIADAKRSPQNGLVFEVVYVINFSLEEKEDRHVGFAKFEGDPLSPSFVPFEKLTEEIVIGWVKEKLGDTEINRIIAEAQARIEDRIQKEKNPEFINGLPWNK